MKVVILAGGQQSTISEIREGIPKPMAYIGDKPLIWHIMKMFSAYGFNDFIVCGGYKVDMIKEYFMDFYIYQSDITVDLNTNQVTIHKKKTENWTVTVVDTGIYSSTGSRINKIKDYIDSEKFIVTFGDCLFDIDLENLCKMHDKGTVLATVAVAKPTGRERLLLVDDSDFLDGEESAEFTDSRSWVNTGCFLLSREIFQYLSDKDDIDRQFLSRLADMRQVKVFRHLGYWNAVETRRDLSEAEKLWNAGAAPWVK